MISDKVNDSVVGAVNPHLALTRPPPSQGED